MCDASQFLPSDSSLVQDYTSFNNLKFRFISVIDVFTGSTYYYSGFSIPSDRGCVKTTNTTAPRNKIMIHFLVANQTEQTCKHVSMRINIKGTTGQEAFYYKLEYIIQNTYFENTPSVEFGFITSMEFSIEVPEICQIYLKGRETVVLYSDSSSTIRTYMSAAQDVYVSNVNPRPTFVPMHLL